MADETPPLSRYRRDLREFEKEFAVKIPWKIQGKANFWEFDLRYQEKSKKSCNKTPLKNEYLEIFRE